MGRYLSGASAGAMGAAIAAAGAVLFGQLDLFGTGRFIVLRETQNWTVPAGVTQVRVRVIAGGGGLVAGGSSSFGSLISATGGAAASGVTPGAGGVGVGGDFQASGGPGGAGAGSGGGANGSQLGNGGAGGVAGHAGGGGGALGGKTGGTGNTAAGAAASGGGGGASPRGAGLPGAISSSTDTVLTGDEYGIAGLPPVSPPIPFPFYAFPGATLLFPHGVGGSGGGTDGSSNNRDGGFGNLGAGGGGAGIRHANTAAGGRGGGLMRDFPHWMTPPSGDRKGQVTTFIGGGLGGTLGRAGAGGGGYAHGVFTVVAGTVYAVTVAAPDAYNSNTPTTEGRSGGLVIVEW